MVKNEIQEMSNFAFLFCKAYGFFMSLGKKQHFVYNFPKDTFKNRQVIIISDHASLDSFLNILKGLPIPKKIHAVIGDMHFRRPKVGSLFNMVKCFGIRPYVTDAPALRNMIRAIELGHSLVFFPEGMYSFCGLTHPIPPATIKFLKKMHTDVVLALANGEFLATPRFQKDHKSGPVEITFTHLFTKAELEEKTVEELEEKLLKHFKYNDFKWNGEKKHHYIGKLPNCSGIEKIIYSCPKCKRNGVLHTEGNEIICKECGNTIVMDDTYSIKPKTDKDFLPYTRVDEWYLHQRHMVREQIRNEKGCTFEYEVKLNRLNEDDGSSMFKRSGEGTLSISEDGTRFIGVENGAETEIFIPIHKSLGASNQDNKFLVLYESDKPIAFEFPEVAPLIIQAQAAVEEFHALVDAPWEKAVNRAYFS